MGCRKGWGPAAPPHRQQPWGALLSRASLSHTLHPPSSIIVHAPSLCTLRHLTRSVISPAPISVRSYISCVPAHSVFVHPPWLCRLRHLARSRLHACSVFARASSPCALRHRAQPCALCPHARSSILHAPSLCMLSVFALCSVMHAPSRALRRRARSFITPTRGHRGQP